MSTAIGVPESFVVRQAAGQTVKKVEHISEDLWDDITMDLAISFQNDNSFEGACLWVPGHRHGCGEADVFGSGAVHFTEGDKPVERGRKVPAEPWLHPDSP